MTHDQHAERIKQDSIREAKDPKTRRILMILGVLMVLLVPITMTSAYIAYRALTDEAETSQQAAGVAVGTADTNKQAAEDLCEQIEALGKTCTTDPSQLDTGSQAVEKVVGKQGVQGIQGIQGLQGIEGATGPEPSDARLIALIRPLLASTYAANPPTPGREGATGATGATGAAGAIGPQGEQGPRGEDGPRGAEGPQGRGIAGLTCNSLTLLELTITYTDGETQALSCGGVAQPEPEPTP